MPTRPQFELPSYKEQEPAVAERFTRIYARPIVLDVRRLGKTFSTRGGQINALADVNFQVHRREFVTVIGPSGCGKSTLIRILAGLEDPTTGSVQLDGKEACGPGADRGMVFQAYTLFPWLTVKRNVMFGLLNKGHGQAHAEGDAMQWIRMVGLERFAECYPHQLSGGMKQRVAIARALANQPRILLMDEPFGALDAQTRMNMQSCLQQIWQNVNITIVFITHDLDEAILLADRIIVLAPHPGRITEVIEVPLIRPRTTEQMVEPAFLATRARLNELIHPASEQSEEDRIPVFRMTLVGDDVL
jgi:NitT/TauT family transport system ATP-binding protein